MITFEQILRKVLPEKWLPKKYDWMQEEVSDGSEWITIPPDLDQVPPESFPAKDQGEHLH
jgi:hypothetical protein